MYEPATHVPSSEWPGGGVARAQRMWDYFQNVRSLCETFLSIPPETLSRATFVVTAHLAMSMIKLIRLHCSDDPDWDSAAAGQTAKLAQLQNRLSDQFRAASYVRGPRRTVIEESQDMLFRYSERIKMLQSWCFMNVPQFSTGLNPPAGAVVAADPTLNSELGQLGDLEFWQMLSQSGYSYDTSALMPGMGPVG